MPSTLRENDAISTEKRVPVLPIDGSGKDQTWHKDNSSVLFLKVIPTPDIEDKNRGQFTSEQSHKLPDDNDNSLIKLKAPPVPSRSFEVLQQWEGVVTEITETSFWAVLEDLRDPTSPEELVELPLAEITDTDRSILKRGSALYWTIGREWSAGGQMRRVSEIWIRRMPQWSKHALKTLKHNAAAQLERFNSELEDVTSTQQ